MSIVRGERGVISADSWEPLIKNTIGKEPHSLQFHFPIVLMHVLT